MKNHTIAVIGCGNVGVNWHLPAYKSMPDLSVVAVCDTNEKAAKNAAEKFGVARFYIDADRMFIETKPEIAAIALPPFLHKSYLQKALAAGCHVIIEKPLAFSYQEAKEMASFAEQSDRRVTVEQNWRFSKISRKVKEIIQEGLIGEPYYIEMRQYGFAYPYFVKTYVGKGKLATMLEMGPHIVDMIRYWFGSEAESIYAKMPPVPHIDHPADWLDAVTINFPENKTAYIIDDWGFKGKELSSLLEGRVNGSEGSLIFEFKDSGQNTIELCCDKREGVTKYDVTEQNWPWCVNVLLTQHLIKVIEVGGEIETDIKENLGTMAIIFAAYESAESGKIVQVKIAD